jgi:hypothetical protein
MKISLSLAAVAAGVLAPASLAAQATSGRQGLPIAPGSYVYEEVACRDAGVVFRYDGTRFGILSPDTGRSGMERIVSARRSGGRYVFRIANRDADSTTNEGAFTDVYLRPLGRGRVGVDIMEEVPARACPMATLPAWAR